MPRLCFVHDSAQSALDLKIPLQDLGYEVILQKLLPLFQLSKAIREAKPDIVHAHYIRTPAYAAFLSTRRPMFLSAHGDDVRHGLNLFQQIALAYSKKNFYSTEDLKGKINGDHLPQPVDLERFYPDGIGETRGLYFLQNTSDPRNRTGEQEYIREIRNFMEVDVIEKGKIPYEDMPGFLRLYSFFFDREEPKSFSKTCLQAMAEKIPCFTFQDCSLEDSINRVESRYEFVLSQHDSRKIAMRLDREYRSAM